MKLYVGFFVAVSAGAAGLNVSETVRCDVLVVGGSLAGTYAALESARDGAKTCLLAETDWLGGQMTNQGICAIDSPHQLKGLWSAFRDRYVDATASNASTVVVNKANDLIPVGSYPLKTANLFVDEANKCLADVLGRVPERGHCWVSYDCCQPSSAAAAFRELAAPYVKSGMLRIDYETVPKAVEKNGKALGAVVGLSRRWTGRGDRPYAVPLSREWNDWYERSPSYRYEKHVRRYRARVFVDATETGELLALANAPYVVGEQNDRCESVGSERVMASVVPLNLEVKPAGDTATKPVDAWLGTYCPQIAADFSSYADDNYAVRWQTYRFWADPTDVDDENFKWGRPFQKKPSLIGYRRLSDSPEITMMNFGQSSPMPERLTDRKGGNDYIWGNVLTDAAGLELERKDWRGGLRMDVLARAECHSMGFAKWLTLQDEVRSGDGARGRTVVPVFDATASRNIFGTGTGFSKLPYVREARRVKGWGGACLTPADYGADFSKVAAESDFDTLFAKFRTSAYYRANAHSIGIVSYPMDRRKYPDGVYPSSPYPDLRMAEIPLEALVSDTVPNLAAAGKTISMHQLVASAARTQPFECNVGRGAGAAAAAAARRDDAFHGLVQDEAAIRRVQSKIVEGGGTVRWFSN